MEEDKDLRKIFNDFNPQLSSDRLFMVRLECKLKAMDAVKMQLEKSQRNHKRAIRITAVTGFIFGVVAALSYPMLYAFIADLISSIGRVEILNEYLGIFTWIIICLLGSALTFTTYDLTDRPSIK